MIILITKLDRSTYKAKSGEVYEGLKLEGWKQDKEGGSPELWEKFMYDWKDSEWIQILEEIGVNGAALIKMKKKGRFWDIEAIEPWRGETVTGDEDQSGSPDQEKDQQEATAEPPPVDAPPIRTDPVEATKISPAKTVTESAGGPTPVKNFPIQAMSPMNSDQAVRNAAVGYAVKILNGMLAADARFKKLLLVGTTSELLGEILMTYARGMEKYIKYGANDHQPDPQELKGPPVETGDPGVAEDDIPF